MKLKYLLGLTWLICFAHTAQGQESRFFMPKQIRQAYKQETRSKDGKPGPQYWQNTTDYKITVKVDPKTRKLDGEETVTYTNNSPDELGFVVVRLYFDVFKKANPRASGVNPEDIGEGVALKSLSINGTDIDLASRNVQRTATNLSIRLPEALKSGEEMELKTSWAQYIPLTNRRTGAADSTSFFVAYWYPQISVYDDVFGWDAEEYSLRTEFYNNLSNFDVTIQAPKNFLVWATGELQNPDEIYPPTIAERYKRALISEERVSVITSKNLQEGYESLSDLWKYKAQNVSDFAFALSDHYLWDAAIQKVEDRKVLISSVYPNKNTEIFKDLTTTQQKIMKHFSEDFPGIPYPFTRFTTFIGLQGGGMEFPMMAYNQGPNLGLTAHEMFHMYFPMYVRINERRFAWMDEGWADYCTAIVTSRFWDNKNSPLFPNFKPSVQGMVGTYEDLPLITSSQFMDASNYGYASYPLPAFVYSMLHFELGEETFKKAYQEYIKDWAQKSPTPYDFFYSFERVSGQDLAWFWKPWFFEQGFVDISIKEFKKGELVLENFGNRPVPLMINVNYQDGSEDTLYVKASIWKDAGPVKVEIPREKELKNLAVNMGVVDDQILDNFYPDLKTQSAGTKISEEIFGVYLLDNFNVDMFIKQKDGIVQMTIPAAGMEAYLLPQEDGNFASLDKSILIKFNEEAGKVNSFNGELKQFQVEIQGKKQ